VQLFHVYKVWVVTNELLNTMRGGGGWRIVVIFRVDTEYECGHSKGSVCKCLSRNDDISL